MRSLAAFAVCIVAACTPSQSLSAPSPTAATSLTAAPSASSAVGAATASPQRTAPPATAPAGAPSGSQRCERLAGGDQSANRVLSTVRAARHPGYDRVVFDFGPGALPPFVVEQVDQVIQGGSGFVKPVAGNAFLVARFIQAGGAGEYRGATLVRPDTDIVREIVLSTNFEGALEFGIGLSGRACPRVSVLASPAR
ncbi:MAG TPA: hypothetical protein VJP45_10135, partial [Candidatus Limnocylindria bacterium]|nr:hypothetical protein [Candidatus Limnocylindria bacterium]